MFSRLGNLIKGFFSLFISGIEKRNPEALLELEQENLRKQIAQFNQGLATHAGLCERIMGQVRKLEAEQKDLRAKTTAHLRAGNKSAAGQYALRLQTIDSQLEENRKQLEQAEGTYKNLIKARDVAVQTARAKIESLKGALNDMRMNQAMAEIHEMASGMITSIGGSGDTLNRLHEMVEEERTKAAGRARMARDAMDMSEVNIKEAEMDALADQALADPTSSAVHYLNQNEPTDLTVQLGCMGALHAEISESKDVLGRLDAHGLGQDDHLPFARKSRSTRNPPLPSGTAGRIVDQPLESILRTVRSTDNVLTARAFAARHHERFRTKRVSGKPIPRAAPLLGRCGARGGPGGPPSGRPRASTSAAPSIRRT